MRRIDLIVVHCSDSDVKNHDDIKVITRWHMERGFSDIGYHFVITKDGGIHIGRAVWLSGAHAKGFNKQSIGICLTGKNKFSDAQFASLKKLCDNLRKQHGISRRDIVGHRALNTNKTCPNFNVAEYI